MGFARSTFDLVALFFFAMRFVSAVLFQGISLRPKLDTLTDYPLGELLKKPVSWRAPAWFSTSTAKKRSARLRFPLNGNWTFQWFFFCLFFFYRLWVWLGRLTSGCSSGTRPIHDSELMTASQRSSRSAFSKCRCIATAPSLCGRRRRLSTGSSLHLTTPLARSRRRTDAAAGAVAATSSSSTSSSTSTRRDVCAPRASRGIPPVAGSTSSMDWPFHRSAEASMALRRTRPYHPWSSGCVS